MISKVENRMVIDSEWEVLEKAIPKEISERLSAPGWVEIGTGVFVPDEDAFNYALERCTEIVPPGIRSIKWTQEFRKMLVEWFFSGDWIKED